MTRAGTHWCAQQQRRRLHSNPDNTSLAGAFRGAALPSSVLWFVLLLGACCRPIQSGMQNSVFSEILGVAINILVLKNETQARLTSRTGFTGNEEGGDPGACVEHALGFVQANTLRQRVSNKYLHEENHAVNEEDVGLPGIHNTGEEDVGLPGNINRTAARVIARFPNQGLNQLATSMDMVARLAHKRLGIHWWAWLPLAVGIVIVCCLAAIATLSSRTPRKEVRPAQVAGNAKHVHEGKTQPLKQKNPASHSLLTSLSLASPPSKRSLTASSSSMNLNQLESDDILWLCPDLLVPKACECNVSVDLKPAPSATTSVTDATGNKVMLVSVQGSTSNQATFPRDARRVVLTTEEGYVLAQCRGSQQVDGEFHLLRADGELFAKLWQSESQSRGPDLKEHLVYTVRCPTGAEWHFRRDLPQLTFDVTDSAGRVLAMSRPEADPRSPERPKQHSVGVNSHVSRVRVASLMDVSVVICGFLTISNLM
eukprot:CAMPEP_0172934440 /NCGR_PEP_ID=MMETSP1075-20121228/221012_1 /TAXON_ID=2916 /ORGANISM="Ceratium fusus, Strain PA161109" /LENGTH=482 /DNA_ID=CAMNT_0013795793 /DNA_START=57 /DNA_END=1504 /DNA_ORIENTATION=-